MRIIISILALAVMTALLGAGCQPAGPSLGTAEGSYQQQGNNGDVSFTLVPRGVEDGLFVVDFRVDTHTGDLSEIDLRQAVKLRVGEMEYSPVEATSLRGHHVQGAFAFALVEAPDEFQIVIMDVRSMGDLHFGWTS